jgi:hypothetical protein
VGRDDPTLISRRGPRGRRGRAGAVRPSRAAAR